MKENTPAFPKKTLILLIVLLVLGISSACIYAYASTSGKTTMTWPIFAGWLAILLLLDALLLLFLRKNWNLLNLRWKIAALLWGSVSIWYWSFAVGYDYFNLNADSLQLSWTTLSYFRDVPLVGVVYIFIALILFSPINKFVEVKDKTQDPAAIYKYIYKYPFLLALMTFVFSILGYVLGVIQLREFAYPPIVEQVKNILNGTILSLHLGVFVYLAVDYLMDDVRLKLGTIFDTKKLQKRQLSKRFFGVALVATLASIGLLSLVGFKTYQNLINDNLIEEIRFKIEENRPSWKDIEKELKSGERGQVFMISPGDNLPDSEFSAETRKSVSEMAEGAVRDFKKEIKIVVFFTEADTNKKIVSVAYPSEHYRSFGEESRFFFTGTFFIAFFLTVIVALLAAILARSLKDLKNAVQEAEKGYPFDFKSGSADEVEDLANAFSLFIGRSQSLQTDLEKTVEERTWQLQEKMEQLEKINNLMVGREIEMVNLKKQIEELKNKV